MCLDVLLSLVRTKTVGHLRDIRRLVVAMSRARLGLYIFCRQSLFASCYELEPVFKQLLKRPNQLTLMNNGERYIEPRDGGAFYNPKAPFGSERRAVDMESGKKQAALPKNATLIIKDLVQMGQHVYQMTQLADASEAMEVGK
jgi:hypothetical protein